jgi:hypothetical protein
MAVRRFKITIANVYQTPTTSHAQFFIYILSHNVHNNPIREVEKLRQLPNNQQVVEPQSTPRQADLEALLGYFLCVWFVNHTLL